LTVPADRAEEERRHQRAALETSIVTYEAIRRRKDGSLICLTASVRAIRDASGALECFVVNEKDVTHLRALRDSRMLEARYRDLLESTPDAIVMVNDTGRIVLVNSQAESVFGYDRGEMLGKPIENASARTLPRRPRRAPLHLSRPSAQARNGRRPGAPRSTQEWRRVPVEISLSPLPTDEGTMAMSAIRDITDRKKAEKKFRDLLESAPDAMVIVDRQGTIVLVNSRTESLFGYSRAELLDKKIEVLVPARFRDRHPGHRTGFFSDPKLRPWAPGSIFRPAQGWKRVSGRDQPEPPGDRGRNAVSSSVRDITDRKRFERSIQERVK